MSNTNVPVALSPGDFGLAEHKGIHYIAVVKRGTTKEQIENPAYWAHVAVMMKPWARIDVRWEDGTAFAEYLVLASERTWARVRCLSFHDLTGKEENKTQADQIMGDYDIKFRSSKRWSVIRKMDNSILQEGMQTEEDARSWLKVHVSAQGITA